MVRLMAECRTVRLVGFLRQDYFHRESRLGCVMAEFVDSPYSRNRLCKDKFSFEKANEMINPYSKIALQFVGQQISKYCAHRVTSQVRH